MSDDKPKTVAEWIARARAAGHDALGIANDPEWRQPRHLHPKTGHECRTLQAERGVQHEVTITIAPGEADDDRHLWYARIAPTDNPSEEVGWMTFGDSPAQAVYMAYELLASLWEECCADKGGGVPHCWCRDETRSWPWNDDKVYRYVGCCRCDHHAPVTEFEE